MPRKEFSDRFLKNLTAPASGRMEYSDIRKKGLHVRVYSGSPIRIVWMFEKRISGGPKRKHTLGTYPELSLSEARKRASILEAEALLGVDRVADSERGTKLQALKALREKTVGELLERYQRQQLAKLKTGSERLRQLEWALGGVKDLSMNVLELGHLLDPIEEKIEEGKDTMSNRIRAALKAFTRWAFERDFVDIDIGSRLPKALSEKPRERTPSIEEVRTIWAASSGMGELWGPFIRLLILTGQRRGEICNLRWSEVDLINGVISKKSAETKNGQPHKTHLSSIALYELQKLAARKNGVFVFTTTGATPVSGISRMKKRLDALLGDNFEAWTFHDLRRAMASALCERGYSEAVVDRILNHQAVGSAPSAVSLVYNTAQHLPERAAALDAWSEIVTSELGSIAELNTYR